MSTELPSRLDDHPQANQHLAPRRAQVRLTRREQQVHELLMRGLSVTQIAATLSIAESTADNHKTRLMRKLGVHKHTELLSGASQQLAQQLEEGQRLIQRAAELLLAVDDGPEAVLADQLQRELHRWLATR